MGTYANSADPAQMLQNVASDQNLHCFLTGISMQNTVNVKIFAKNPKIQMDSSKKGWTSLLVKKGLILSKASTHNRTKETATNA